MQMATLKLSPLAMEHFVTGGRRCPFFPAASGGVRAGMQNQSHRMLLELFGSMLHWMSITGLKLLRWVTMVPCGMPGRLMSCRFGVNGTVWGCRHPRFDRQTA